MKLYLSIDLESWAYPDISEFVSLDSLTRKKIDNGFIFDSTNKILDLLAKYNKKLTFFALGELFEWYPKLFGKIKNAGHEIAYHSHRHKKILSVDTIKAEMKASQDFITEFKPIGFRAPEIYLIREAIPLLIKAGFRYSSSVYGNYLDILKQNDTSFYEFPISTFLYGIKKRRVIDYPRPLHFKMLASEIPFGSGYFFASLPLFLTEKFIRSYFEVNKPVFIFVHNWQIISPKDATFPNFKYKVTHPLYFPYTIAIIEKIKYLLKNYNVARMDELVCIQENTGIEK